jgi:glycosyltransferase 2 family protein
MGRAVGTASRSARLSTGVQLFASGSDEQRARRPTDVALLVVGSIVLVLAGVLSQIAQSFERNLAELLADLPGLFDLVWWLFVWAPTVYATALLAASLIRRRLALAVELVLAATLAVAIAALLVVLLGDGSRSVLDLLTDIDGPPVFPPGLVLLVASAIVTASPHLTRPFRHLGRWAVALQVFGTAMLGATTLSGAAGAVSLGLVAASTIHLVFGSPGGRPTASRIRVALSGVGLEVDEISAASLQSAGVVRFDATSEGQRLHVKVYGRDAWDAQVLANLWRLAWYRSAGRTARLSRVELVEHEAFVTLLAERAGVAVPNVVTAGSAGQGDALLVVRSRGTPLPEANPSEDEVSAASLWDELALLHEAAIVHGRIDLDRVLIADDGSLSFGDLSTASVVGDETVRHSDRAQVLVLTLLLVGEEGALAAAREAVGDDGVAEMLPYVQTAAMPPLIRRELDGRSLELDDLRKRVASHVGAEEGPLIKLRRVSVGSLLNLALLTLATYTLISVIGGMDVEELVDALGSARWGWLALALLLAQLARLPSALSTMGAIEQPLPFGPLAALQFAISYVNLAIPSSAARVAITVRFFERFGIPAVVAIAAGAIDSVSGFVVQIGILGSAFLFSDIDLQLTTDSQDLSGLVTLALIGLGIIVVAAVASLAVSSVRSRVVGWIHEAKVSLRVLRSPHKLLQLFGGNVLSQVVFALALGATVRGFGYEVPVTSLLVINTVVSLFAGLLPVPGGIGVSEAGITLGLTRVGLPSEGAFAAALTYRAVSFYLPPIWGWFSYRWLVRQRFL